MSDFAQVPMKTVGPMKIIANETYEVSVPLATFELPLWPSVSRGAKITRLCDGVQVIVVDERMTRSIMLEAESAAHAHEVVEATKGRMDELQDVVDGTSRFAKLVDINRRIVGRLLYLRFEFSTGDAAGHNMVTQASDHLMNWCLKEYSGLRYVSISGNYCIDKKTSAVNAILGRGKRVIAEMKISREICEKHLRTTPEALAEINTKKNLIGSIVAGSLMSANAHYANMLLGFYLACGQDVANIVEGSQGITFIEAEKDCAYMSVTIPNIIIGSVGNGKELGFVRKNLNALGCDDLNNDIGKSSKRLAEIAAATVFCGELSLLAAQTNPGELMRSHVSMERKEK